MRIVRFLHSDGLTHTGVRQGAMICDMGNRDPLDGFTATEIANAPRIPFDESKLEVPLARVPKLIALAGNYAKHIAESGFSDVASKVWTPQIFWKPSTSLLKHRGTIYLRKKNNFLDWEAELAVVIGKGGRDIAAENAFEHVFGYSIINDISERKYNAEITGRDKREFDPFFDWLIGKWFDGSAPLGPELTTKDEVTNPEKLGIRLLLNGEVMQDSNTSNMIVKIQEAIANISAVMTLERGDVIAMGTPEGVGFARGRQLKPGDRMRVEIDELGALETTVEQIEGEL